MEIKILDGRGSFYQWDHDQKLQITDPQVEELHYATEDGHALCCVVREQADMRVADVPNILLQKAEDLRVYAVAGARTLYCRIFRVNRREKPDDYIYTETEVRSVEKIVEDMLESAVPQVDLSDYVKKSDYAEGNNGGIVKVNSAYGLRMSSDHTIRTVEATNAEIKSKTNTYKVIVPENLDYAIKVGLTTNTIPLTDAEKAAVRAWLGID